MIHLTTKGVLEILAKNDIKYDIIENTTTICLIKWHDSHILTKFNELEKTVKNTTILGRYSKQLLFVRTIRKLFNHLLNRELITFEIENYISFTYDVNIKKKT